MNPSFYRIRLLLSVPRLIPHVILFLLCRNKHVLEVDISRWADIEKLPKPRSNVDFVLILLNLMTFLPEFRTLFYFRCGGLSKLLCWMCPTLSTLAIEAGSIGSGLYIQHGQCTLVTARSIGKNCWINQQVTIGYSDDTEPPIIGDNVRICAGAKVLGNLRIGDNATVGANSVVIGDVPANATVMGVPAKIIFRKG